MKTSIVLLIVVAVILLGLYFVGMKDSDKTTTEVTTQESSEGNSSMPVLEEQEEGDQFEVTGVEVSSDNQEGGEMSGDMGDEMAESKSNVTIIDGVEVPGPVGEIPGPRTFTVIYTNDGYVPTLLDIEAGDTVVFKNQSDKKMWTASDPHPTHTDNSDFDSRKGMNSGEDYSFTFSAGDYHYHNHLRPAHKGTIQAAP